MLDKLAWYFHSPDTFSDFPEFWLHICIIIKMGALPKCCIIRQGSHRLDKYLNLEGFLEKSLKLKFALKSTCTGKALKGLEKSLNSSIFCGA